MVVASSRVRHPLEARTLARLAAQYAGDGPGEVVGFGLSNDERRGDTAEWAPAFAIARRAGLASVPHGGELLGASHVRAGGRAPGAGPDRPRGALGGGPARCSPGWSTGGWPSRCAPRSNVSLGVFAEDRHVPLRTLTAAGATVALGADDPLLFGSRLTDQYELARHVHGYSDAELADLARGSIRASRATDGTKARLLAGVDAWLSRG